MRAKIALRNLFISQTIIIAFLIFAYLIWFPHSFADLGGFTKTAFMLIFADLILGPVLVYIVFKEGKKHLKFDINILLGIQIIAFVFGAYSLFLKHPAYAVFTHDRFRLINVSEVHPQQTLSQQIKTSFFTSTKFVIAKIPIDRVLNNELLFSILINGQPDIDARPEFYNPLNDNIDHILSKRLNVEQAFKDSKSQTKLTKFLNKNGGTADDYAFYPLRGNNQKDVIWAFSLKTKLPVGIIDSDPWLVSAEKLVMSDKSIELDAN